MPTTLTFRRGTTTQNNNFTGAAGEITVDTDTKTLRVHDNSTAGGEGVVGLTAAQTLTNKTLTSPTINGGTFSGTFTGTISPGQVTTNSIVSNGSNADISIQPSGTGDVLLSALRVNGTTLDSSDSTKITIAENVDVTGTLAVAGALSSATSLALASGATVTGIADEDNMSSNSATLLATQQSVKAYVDTEIGNISTTSIVQNNSNITVADSGSGTITVTVDGSTIGDFTSTGLQLGGSGARVTTVLDEDNLGTNSATALATQQSIKAYVDAQNVAQALTFVGDDSTGTAVNSGETFKIAGGSNVTTAVSGDTLTITGATPAVTALNNATANELVTVGSTTTELDGESGLTFDGSTLAVTGAVTISGNLTVNGDTSTVSTTNTTIEDNIIELNSGISQSLNDAGIIIERGTTGNNAAIIWDESADTFVLGTTTATAADKSGGITIDAGSLKIASLEVDGVTVTDNIITSNSSNADLEINANGSGTVVLENLSIAGDGATVTGILDEDAMGSDSNVKLATQQSIKAYVDAQDAAIASDTLTLTNKTFDVEGTGNSISNIDVADFKAAAIVLESEGIGSNDNDTTLPTSAAVKDYVDTQITAEDLDVAADSGTAAVDLDSQSLTVTGGTGIGTTATGQAVTINIDSTVATLTGSQTLTNKVLTSPTINSPTIATPTITGAMTATSVTTNDVTTNGSNADLDLAPQGTGKVKLYGTYTFPTSDGSNGTALVTDGSGTLSFGSVGSKPVSDDGAAVAITDKRITSTARTIDSFHSSFQDSVLYYVVSNDHNEDAVNVQKVSVCHNDSGAFISSAGALSKASTSEMTTFTAGLDNDMVRVKAASTNAVGGTLSFYKFGLGDNTSTGTSGNVIISQNTDVDSASESLVSFAHATFRGAKLFVSVNNASKTEVGNVEALVVHDGSDAFISQFGGIQTGNNALITLTAAIDGSNVVVSAAGLETNLRVTVHAIMLKDTMTSNSGTYANAEAIAPVTISSSATEIDTLVEASNNGAVYYLVSKNASEGEYAVNEVFVACGSGEITVASGPYVSTKGTNQLAFTTDYKDDVENTGQLFASSTSGGSTTVSAYRINLLAK